MSSNSILTQSDIEVIYDLYFDSIYRFFYWKVLKKDTAEDLTSETFLNFVSQAKKNNPIRDPKNFLFGIAKIVFTKFLKRKYKQELELKDSYLNFAGYVEDFLSEAENIPTTEEKVAKYLKELPGKQKQVLNLRLIQKMSIKEIAQKLNKNINYVKTTQKRGIKSLKRIIAMA